MEDQKMIVSRFSELEGEIVNVCNSKMETIFSDEIETIETVQIVSEQSLMSTPKSLVH
jgi:hypothetical protein